MRMLLGPPLEETRLIHTLRINTEDRQSDLSDSVLLSIMGCKSQLQIQTNGFWVRDIKTHLFYIRKTGQKRVLTEQMWNRHKLDRKNLPLLSAVCLGLQGSSFPPHPIINALQTFLHPLPRSRRNVLKVRMHPCSCEVGEERCVPPKFTEIWMPPPHPGTSPN